MLYLEMDVYMLRNNYENEKTIPIVRKKKE